MIPTTRTISLDQTVITQAIYLSQPNLCLFSTAPVSFIFEFVCILNHASSEFCCFINYFAPDELLKRVKIFSDEN